MILQYTLTNYMPAESYIDAHVNIGYVIDQVGRWKISAVLRRIFSHSMWFVTRWSRLKLIWTC